MDSLYQAQLLAHYKNPLNNVLLQEYTFEHVTFNHLCGDQATVRLLLVNHTVKGISIQAKGCVISVATASLFSGYIKEKSCCDLKNMGSGLVLDMIGIPLGPVRIKCALLSFDVIMQGLNQYCCK